MGRALLHFDNTYARELEGFFAPWQAATAPAPRLLLLNYALAEELGLDSAALDSDLCAAIFSGNQVPEGSHPLAQAYAGHQFGHFSPQLGDGRALLLGELIDRHGRRRDMQLKGSGRTPFSRGGDGKAALGPVLREYVIGEAMHALGIPTTRALAAVTTGETIHRGMGLPGAILTRIAASHIRVGTFQFFAARNESNRVKQLADYTIARHYPALKGTSNPYLGLFAAVSAAQAALIARWMLVGFIHGVMNTDNISIAGETIDYGPCAFMDSYDPETVFSSIDAQGRYAYAHQPLIAQWNITRFAETLIDLVHPDADEAVRLLTEQINDFPTLYTRHWLDGMRAKMGLTTAEDDDLALAQGLLSAMEGQDADYTQVFRGLSAAVRGDPAQVRAHFANPAPFDLWLAQWQARLAHESTTAEARAEAMDQVNPLYIPRNHKVEEALAAATQDQDLTLFKALLAVLEQPFAERPGLESYTQPAPEDFGPFKTFCGT
ncbi:hypothetical protein BBC27_11195 [Acidithiobacillus ferrivorans]|uniref:Protein nucleotidyltransferase YdiU n=1 Tax=Acidithiobacillus ferrivorans TaxID=160808 RepID=A0A1B9BYJ2_9PROT|nr:YdiU family protein [Acidithiobacillus ferrivorans]OCB02781.1 hypothetical protein BBC27_11195 [Acidithiobacillus ferrivorans]